MSRKTFPVSILLLIISFPLWGSQPDTLQLEEVVVSTGHAPAVYSGLSRIVNVIGPQEISTMPAGNIQDILEYTAAMDVRQRGSQGVQADLSMRGGSFEQVLILLNGVKINDPQTGHHNLNIPVDISDIEKIEILEGPGSRYYGPNAFSGAVNIVTRKAGDKNISGAVHAGQFGYRKIYASGGLDTGPLKNFISLGNTTSEGFTDNTDFNKLNLLYRGNLEAGPAVVDMQAGHMDKGFGANSFYSALYPDQYERVRSTFANFTVNTGKRTRYRQSFYVRRHHDRFELFRYEQADWYEGHNYHMTGIYGTDAVLNIPWSHGSFSIGAEARTERIYSSVLGERLESPRAVKNEENVFYDYFKQRSQVNLTGSGTVILKESALSAGLLVTRTGNGSWGTYGGADISHRFNNNISWFASYNRSLRLPSFTEMYYKGPVNKGNADLIPEEAATLETGIRFTMRGWHGHVNIFNRKGVNIIDWVKMEDDLIWESRNITRLNTYGGGFEIRWSNPFKKDFQIREFRTGYTFLETSRQSEEYISAYILDHLRHKFVSGVILSFHKSAGLSVMSVYQNRAGSYTEFASGSEIDYDPFMLVDLGINISIIDNIAFSAQANNLFNIDYTDIGNVPVPGRWIRAGLAFTFP